MIKFPTDYWAGKLREDQVAAHECYTAMMEMDIEEHRTVAEPIERLEEIRLNDSEPDRTIRIGALASPMVRQVLTAFLKNNWDVFAWSHEDMLGINLSVMVHKLNVSPFFPPIR